MSFTVRKVNSTLRQKERIPKTQTDIARNFTLQAFRREAHKFTLGPVRWEARKITMHQSFTMIGVKSEKDEP